MRARNCYFPGADTFKAAFLFIIKIKFVNNTCVKSIMKHESSNVTLFHILLILTGMAFIYCMSHYLCQFCVSNC